MTHTICITGANRGLGLEFARQYAALGHTIIGACRDPDHADAAELRSIAKRVLACDISDQASVDAMAKELKGTPIDILINNGALPPDTGTLAELDMARVEQVVSVNGVAPVRIAQALLPNLRKGDRKVIASISSDLGSIAGANHETIGYYAYRAGKAALNMFNACIGRELQPAGFTCLALHPGWVRTRMGGDRAPLDAKASVEGMIRVIENSSPAQSGAFLDFKGHTLPW
jgi:NAD(P)-dependent dehydrogenase (short-subunit alcohol dehydrogenase family)